MSRVIWKGNISFGLVQIPVSLYPAESRDELRFSLLDKHDLAPIGNKRYNKNSGKDVPWNEVVKGYEYEEGKFVVLTDEDFRRANVKATQTVDIIDFVADGDIPDIYYETPYYLEPGKKGEKGYALLRETLKKTGRVGIAKVVLHSREHLAALKPYGNALVLDLLRFHHELRDSSELEVPGPDLKALKISPKEIQMAEQLIESMVEAWQPEKYQDIYRDDLLRFIEQKVAAGQTTSTEPEPVTEQPAEAEVIDLMTLLKRSVEQTGRSEAKKAAPKRAVRPRRATKKRA